MAGGGDAVIRVRVALMAICEGRILLARHLKEDRSYWMLPGGGVQHGETLTAALERELQEEAGVRALGLRLQALCESIDPDSDRHILHVVFRGELVEGEARATGADERVAEVRWMPLDEFFGAPFYPDVKDYIMQAAERPVGPLYREIRWIP